MTVVVIERAGRRACTDCDGEVGFPCLTCGGCGSLPPDLMCTCGRPLHRHGWHYPIANAASTDDPRLPRYFCRSGHEVAIQFTPADERGSEAA